MTKRTYNPKKARRRNRHGFLKRSSDLNGKNVLKRRRRKGRTKLSV